MSASDIRSKIAAGLSRANKAVSDGLNEVWLVKKTAKPKSITDTTPVTTAESLLVDAIFSEYSLAQIDDTVLKGDRMLICQASVAVAVGDFVEVRGALTERYVIVSLEDVSPRGETLLYKAQVRRQ